MTTAVPNTLLALLLALKNLEKPLNEGECEALAEVGQQLKLDPDDWDFIEGDLMAIIQANDGLNQVYQQAKARLDTCDRPIPPDLLPTDAELEKDPRARFEGKPDKESNEISNQTVKVLKTEKPEETAKKLSFLERLSQSLNQPSKND